MERVSIDGISIRIYREGEGPLVVYLHSGFGELGALPFLKKLVENGFSVLAPEMPGFGSSDACRDWHKIEDAVFFYRLLFDFLDLGGPAVIGQSLGGWLAAELAVWFPDRVSSLVLIDSVGLYVEGAPVSELFGTDPVKLMPLVFPNGGNILEHVLPALEGNTDSDSVILHFFRAMETTAAIGWSPYMHDPKLIGRLSKITAPTLILHGKKDGIVPIAHARAFRDGIPNARLEILEGLGHLPALEDPAAVADLVCGFLESRSQ